MAERRRYVRQPDTCSVDGCGHPPKARGFCRMHYSRWRRSGTATPRLRGQVIDGMRLCADCGMDTPVGEIRGSYCLDCDRVKQRTRAALRYVAAPSTDAECSVCGNAFAANGRRRFACSPECSAASKKAADSEYQKANREKARAANERWRRANLHKLAEKQQRRRARERGATIGPVDLAALWTGACGICGDPMDELLRHPNPMSRSLDHIKPLAGGGAHSQDNLQWSHLVCNVRKGARVSEEVA